jgi:hypothetical protein
MSTEYENIHNDPPLTAQEINQFLRLYDPPGGLSTEELVEENAKSDFSSPLFDEEEWIESNWDRELEIKEHIDHYDKMVLENPRTITKYEQARIGHLKRIYPKIRKACIQKTLEAISANIKDRELKNKKEQNGTE